MPSPASPATASGSSASGTASPSSCSTPAASTWPTRTSWRSDIQRQARLGMAEADAVLMVVDARAGVRAGDAELAATLRGAEVPVLRRRQQGRPARGGAPDRRAPQARARRAASRSPRPTASAPATCSIAVVAALGDLEPGEEPADRVRVAVIGRPNAGKSSLVNAFLGSERVIVSERAGTTRDAIDTELEVDGRSVVLVDTAGLRRRSKVGGIDRLLRPAPLRTRGRARRRRPRRLRRQRRDHRRGPAGRGAGDAGGVRDPDRPQQVGRDPHRHRRRPRPGRPQAATAAGGGHLLGAARSQRRQPVAEGAGARRPGRLRGSRPRS